MIDHKGKKSRGIARYALFDPGEIGINPSWMPGNYLLSNIKTVFIEPVG